MTYDPLYARVMREKHAEKDRMRRIIKRELAAVEATPPIEDRTVCLRELGRILGLKPMTIYKTWHERLARGEIPKPIKAEGHPRWHRGTLMKWLAGERPEKPERARQQPRRVKSAAADLAALMQENAA